MDEDTPVGRLPTFSWDAISAYRARAAQSGRVVLDLSVASPVDPVPASARRALALGADTPGYPAARGEPATRQACAEWLSRRFGLAGIDPDTQIIPLTGTREMLTLLPFVLGAGPGAVVLTPRLCYPAYTAGAAIANARSAAYSGPCSTDPTGARLLWLNTPNNPSGEVLGHGEACEAVEWARSHRVVVASDECYLDMIWDGQGTSVLSSSVSGTDRAGVLAFHSLSKRSNMAGYRAGFVAGDAALIAMLAEFRVHAGLLVPLPVQAAMAAALADDEHAEQQRGIYRRRRAVLIDALRRAGFRIDHSAAGPFLWCTRGEPAQRTVEWFAGRGVLVAPGDFYGPDGTEHVRVSLTALDDDIEDAAARITDRTVSAVSPSTKGAGAA